MTDVRENLATHAIPREVARRKFRNWINYARNELKFNPKAIPKSIFIPLIDIENLMKAFRIFGKREMSGVRIYLMRDEPYQSGFEHLHLKCFVVPTVHVKSGKDGYHQDAIITIPPLNTAGHGGSAARVKTTSGDSSEGTETIYDLTTSCPPDCDGTDSWLNEPE